MKHSMYNTGNRDANEKEILAYLNARNVDFVQLKPGAGADLIVQIHPMVMVEVKNPKQPESKQALTDCELEKRAYCTATGIPYIVVKTVEDMSKIVDEYFGRL